MVVMILLSSPFNFSSLWSHPRKFLNFPCLMRFSICCFKSKYSSVSCPWSLWKQQYLFLLCLLGSLFIFSGHFKYGSSLICIRTCSSGIFNGVYCWFRSALPSSMLSLTWTTGLLNSPYDNSYFSKRWSWWFFYLPFQFLVLVVSSKEISQFSLSYEIFNLLL